MIEYKNLSSWYPRIGKQKLVLDNCSFRLRAGAITALSGLNGSGKSTLMKSILGLSLFSSGELFCNDEIKGSLLISNFFTTGYAPELSPDSFDITPLDFFKLNNLLSKPKVHDNSPFSLSSIVKTFDLEEYALTSFKKLSKGTKKRVLIANALLNNPEVLILDEPFEGLDQEQRSKLKKILTEFKNDKVILISSHESLELKSFCDDYLHIQNAKLVELNND